MTAKPPLRDAPLDRTVERMKAEILADMRAGRVPRTVRSFQDLHDHVDANEYGPFTEALGDDTFDVGTDADADYANAAQGAVHEWLAAGGHLKGEGQ